VRVIDQGEGCKGDIYTGGVFNANPSTRSAVRSPARERQRGGMQIYIGQAAEGGRIEGQVTRPTY
jgi:hypothetical protein